MKKKFVCCLTTAALLATCGTAFAAPTVQIDNRTLQTDQPPIIVESRTLVPMRTIFEALGCDVSWDEASKTVMAQQGLEYIALTIGEQAMYVDSDEIKLDVPAQLVNGRTMVPLRAVAEALHATVSWDAATETVKIQPAAQGTYRSRTEAYTETKDHVALDMAYPQFLATDSAITMNINSQLAAASHSRATAMQQELSTVIDQTEAAISCTGKERYAITYNQGNYVSILFQTVQDMRGAHPSTVRNAVTYNMKTGKTLALTDILKGDQAAIDKLIVDGFTAQIKAQPEGYFSDAEALLAQAVADKAYDYYLTKDGLTIFFQVYQIAPYAAGFREYTIPFTQTDAFQQAF